MNNPSLIFDFETVDNKPTAAVVSMAAIVFQHDDHTRTFEDLIGDTRYHFTAKFSIRPQLDIYKRTVGASTMAWWKQQAPEVKSVLEPSSNDIDMITAITRFKEFCDTHRINKYSFAFCRGQSFDFPLIADIVHKHFTELGYDYGMFPVPFWNQRDTRSFLDGLMMTLGARNYVVAKGALAGFVKHNALHDCAKDAYLIQKYLAYASGKEPAPTETDTI